MNTSTAHVPESLYASAEKIYPRSVQGRFARLRKLAVWALLGFFYVTPWLRWDGMPLVLLDLPARRFHIFGMTLVPQDLFLLTGLLVIAALTLFLVTTLAGRLWCGYACPQTVWTELFMWIEQWTEGDRHQRMKLDKAPWSAKKLLRKGSKHVLWVLLAWWTGLTFVGFFTPMPSLVADAAQLQLGGWPLFWSIFYGFATWGFAGFMREQVCRYMCPYARFQSVMFDKDTLIISYDALRGEPRKHLAKREKAAAGDCIDCLRCVQVCPTGIDIRDGLQYECIACAACADACDEVMDRVGKPRGLVRYSSTHRDEGGELRFFRPRAIGYAVVWLAVVVGFATLVFTRSDMELDVIRDRHTMARSVAGGFVENIYTVKVTNKAGAPREVRLTAVDESGRSVQLSRDLWTVAPYASLREVISVRVPPLDDASTMGLTFKAYWTDDEDGAGAQARARFIGQEIR